MATTKSRSTSTRSKTSSTAKRSSPSTTKRSAKQGLVSRVKSQPYAGAAIATGAVAAIAAAAAGAFFFSRRDKSFSEARDELGEKFTDMGGRIKDGLSEAKTKASSFFTHERTQQEIAEEAQSLKETGDGLDAKSKRGAKAGAIAY